MAFSLCPLFFTEGNATPWTRLLPAFRSSCRRLVRVALWPPQRGRLNPPSLKMGYQRVLHIPHPHRQMLGGGAILPWPRSKRRSWKTKMNQGEEIRPVLEGVGVSPTSFTHTVFDSREHAATAPPPNSRTLRSSTRASGVFEAEMVERRRAAGGGSIKPLSSPRPARHP